ncbi:hypothetical protein BKA65DRAFT_556022 [Rhexocercosporidium sp. MPI-PUGE-AT-0058]|nr:hypothetical protein BKA65DRAFT_556022 [Rhexocercosporidium sp. MPI-PUGE-AT-0058]
MSTPYDLPKDASTINQDSSVGSKGGNPKIQERAVNIESEYDYGSRSGVWRLFRLFNKLNYKYTLYAVGKAIEDNPAVGLSSVKNGHDVASHAYRASSFLDAHNT